MNDDWFDFCDGVSDRLYRYASIEDLQKKAVSMEKFAITALALLQKNLPAETYDEVMRKNPGMKAFWTKIQNAKAKEKVRIQKEREQEAKRKQKLQEIVTTKVTALKKLTPEQIQALGLQSEAKRYKVHQDD